MDRENVVYQLRAHYYINEKDQLREAGNSFLKSEFDNAKNAYEQLKFVNIRQYFKGHVFKHLLASKDGDEKKHKLLEYLSIEFGLDKKAVETIKNNINFSFNSSNIELSFEQMERIHDILQIDFYFVKKINIDDMPFYAFIQHLCDTEDGLSHWLLYVKFENYDDAIDHVIHRIIQYYIQWKEWFDFHGYNQRNIWCVSGPVQRLTENPERFLKFMEQSKYFTFTNDHIELREIPKSTRRTSILTLESGKKAKFIFSDYAEDIKKECRELIKIMREDCLFTLERV